MMIPIKSVSPHSKSFQCFFERFLSYSVCLPSFQSIDDSSLSKEKYDGDNFTFTHWTFWSSKLQAIF